MELVSVTQSAWSGLVATSDEYEELNSVSLFKIKNKRPLMNQGRKETFGLIKMKKLHSSLLVPYTEGDHLNPTTETATTSLTQRQKVRAENMRSLRENYQESDEGQSLIQV